MQAEGEEGGWMAVALRKMVNSDSWFSVLGLSSASEKQKGQIEIVFQGCF